MSSPWVNKTTIQNQSGASYVSNDLETSGFSNSVPFDSSFEPSQFQNQQLQHRMQNGSVSNGSPASFSNSQYQTNSLVPSKRPREESIRASPQQTPGLLPLSRSQTPQQNPYPSYQSGSLTQQHSTQQIPYSRLQDGSGNASPSPVMSNQIRPSGIGVPQRVSTTSPHPFSPVVQQFPQQSPSFSEQNIGRFDISQQNTQYAQSSGYPQNFGQSFSPPLGHSSTILQQAKTTPYVQQSPLSQQSQASQLYQQQQQRLLYQMQLQQQQQQHRSMLARGSITPNTTSITPQQIQASNGQFQGARSSLVYTNNRVAPNPETFMKSLVTFMQAKKLPLEINPIVGNRAISLTSLYFTVAKFGGYKAVGATKGWAEVAAALQFHPMEHKLAPLLLKEIYERNLCFYEEAFAINQQNQRAQLMQPNSNVPGPQISPTKQQNSQPPPLTQQINNYIPQQQQTAGQQLQNQIPVAATPSKQAQPLTHQQLPPSNGFSTPQQAQVLLNPLTSQIHTQDNLSRNLEITPPQNANFPTTSPVSATRSGGLTLPSPQNDSHDIETPLSQKITLPSVYEPKTLILDTYGGADIPSLMRLGGELNRLRPDVPAVGELGTIDMHAITMSLQSGIHAEVRLALDTLVCLSVEPRLQLDLRSCEDLVDTLIDCAEVQVELLAEHPAEVSDVMLIGSYEDVSRGCRSEHEILQDIPVFGSLEYELDRAVDRLICITTILRNLSFYETNHPLLADELVIKFLCVVIRHIGTRSMLLRSNSNTLDFMKDVIIFLSNLAQQIELPGREQALCLLHFLLAFAPYPTPNSSSSETVTFSSYNPNIHRYLPPAVDSLAKLLARDEPNRSLYKAIFTSDMVSIPPFYLLTRAFALAISSVPENGQDFNRANLSLIIEARKPFLMQGILAAGILSSLAPGYETGIAKSWLTSEDGFSQSLCRLVISLCIETSSTASRQPINLQGTDNELTFHIILGGITVLRRLVEKSRNPEDPNSIISPPGVLAKGSLLAAMNVVQPKLQGVLKQLYTYVGLGA